MNMRELVERAVVVEEMCPCKRTLKDEELLEKYYVQANPEFVKNLLNEVERSDRIKQDIFNYLNSPEVINHFIYAVVCEHILDMLKNS